MLSISLWQHAISFEAHLSYVVSSLGSKRSEASVVQVINDILTEFSAIVCQKSVNILIYNILQPCKNTVYML